MSLSRVILFIVGIILIISGVSIVFQTPPDLVNWYKDLIGFILIIAGALFVVGRIPTL